MCLWEASLSEGGICIQWTGVLEWSAGMEYWSAGMEYWNGITGME